MRQNLVGFIALTRVLQGDKSYGRKNINLPRGAFQIVAGWWGNQPGSKIIDTIAKKKSATHFTNLIQALF